MRFYEEEFARLASAAGLVSYTVKFELDPALSASDLDDAYVIRTTAEGGTLTASNERSLLQAVYRFFYHLGVRYLGPGRRYEWIPEKIDARTLVQDVTIRPSYRHRGVCIEGADSLQNILDMIDWLPKLGMNSFFLQFKEPVTFLRRWYEHTGNSLLAKEAFDPKQAHEEMDRAMRDRGLLHHRVGHGWTGEVLEATADGWDREQKALPENILRLTAEVNGHRGLFGGVPLNTNLCMSDPEARNRFVQAVVSYAADHPEVNCLHVWLADDCNNHCECEACRRKTPTDWYIDLLNEIDERLTEEGLASRIVFLLYLELLWAPVESHLKNPDRFILMFAPISRSFEESYRNVGEVSEPPSFKLNHIQLPVGLAQNLAFLKPWQQVFAGDSFDYDYHLGRAHYGDLGYMRISRLLNEDIYQLNNLDLNGMIACQELRAGFPHFLPNYCMGYTLTERAFSFGDQEDEYFMAAYGDYAREVMEYLETLSRLTSPDWFNGKGPRRREDLIPRYEEALALVLAKRTAIAAMHSPHPVTERFLDMLRYHSEFAELYLKACLARMADNEAAVHEAYLAFDRLICENELKFQDCLDVYRIHEIMRNYTKIS